MVTRIFMLMLCVISFLFRRTSICSSSEDIDNLNFRIEHVSPDGAKIAQLLSKSYANYREIIALLNQLNRTERIEPRENFGNFTDLVNWSFKSVQNKSVDSDEELKLELEKISSALFESLVYGWEFAADCVTSDNLDIGKAVAEFNETLNVLFIVITKYLKL